MHSLSYRKDGIITSSLLKKNILFLPLKVFCTFFTANLELVRAIIQMYQKKYDHTVYHKRHELHSYQNP